MAKFRVLAILVSALVLFGTTGTLSASTQAGDSDILIKCSTCGVEFTSQSAAKQHLKDHPGHEMSMPADPLIKCSTCGAEFTAGAGLKKNVQTNPEHQGEPLVKCSTCGAEFTNPEL